MNENLNKDNQMMIACDCGHEGSVYPTDWTKEFYVKCPKCSKKIFSVFCTNCQTGYALPELEVNSGEWKCGNCGENHSVSNIQETNLVFHSDLNQPEGLTKSEKAGGCFSFILDIFSKI